MRQTLLALSLLLAAASSVAAADRLSTRRLGNGMTVVLAPAVPGEAVALHLTLDAGSRHDPRSRPGTAWVATRVIGARLPGFEADLNPERAVFTATVPPAQAGDALRRIREALAAPEFTSFERPARSGHGPAAEELLLQLVYGRKPHGHRADADAVRVTRNDVQRFLREHYGPASAVLAIAGTFDEAAVAARIEQTVATLPSGAPRRPCKPYGVKLRAARTRELIAETAKQTEIYLGYPTAVSPTPDWFAMNILADIIGQGPESRLQTRLVAKGLATDFAEGQTESPCTTGLLRMRARLTAGTSIDAALAAIDEELARLGRELVTDAELAIAREQERRWTEEGMSTPEGFAGSVARAALFYGDPARTRSDVDRMFAVTAEDVRRVAQKYLQPSNRAIVSVISSREDGRGIPLMQHTSRAPAGDPSTSLGMTRVARVTAFGLVRQGRAE
jgi:predicted Zn-dependent peptidase